MDWHMKVLHQKEESVASEKFLKVRQLLYPPFQSKYIWVK